jgi:hypothetical protein
MEKMKDIAILNLCSELPRELKSYFETRKVNLLASDSSLSPSHILVDSKTNLKEVAAKYLGAVLISLSQPADIAEFYKLGGSLVVDKSWLKNEMGPFVLDKFFQENGGINLSEKFPSFQQQGSFIVSNPFGTGDYLDRLVYHAFSTDHGAIAIRSYFDNIVMFLASLRDQGKMGMPIEVSYGSSQDIFGIQMQFNSQNFKVEEVSRKLKSHPSRKNEEYLLYHAVHSTGFFDFTYLESIEKVFITSLWMKGERIDFENKGFLFSTLKSAQAVAAIPEQGVQSFIAEEPELIDFIDISAEEREVVEEEAIVISGGAEEDDFSQTIKGSAPEVEFSQTIKGSKDEPETSQTIKGSKEEPGFSQTIKGSNSKEKEVSQVIKGSAKEEDKTVFKFGATPKSEQKDFRLSAAPPQDTKADNFMTIKTLANEGVGIGEGQKSPFNLLKPAAPKTTETNREKEFLLSTSNKKSATAVEPAMAHGPSDNEKMLDLKVKTLNTENDRIKSQLKVLMAEVKIVKESRNALAEQLRGDVASEQINKLEVPAEDKENMLLNSLKAEELKTKRLLIESAQKDTLLAQEIERGAKLLKAKEMILDKTKEVFTKSIEKKDAEINALNQKVEEMAKLGAGPQLLTQQNTIKDMEKQNINLTKMLDMYKAKVTSMAAGLQKQSVKTDEEVMKDDNRKLQMINTQLKNQLDVSKKDIARYQEKVSSENTTVLTLKKEKANLEQMLKKANLINNKEGPAVGVANNHEQELKKLQTHMQFVESQNKEQSLKIKDLEAKLAEAARLIKTQATNEDPSKKAIQLEMNVKKLTQDLVESRNQLTEMKKETNKLRQEKVGLQNLMDKMKKDAEKEKNATPKKAPGGKVA